MSVMGQVIALIALGALPYMTMNRLEHWLKIWVEQSTFDSGCSTWYLQCWPNFRGEQRQSIAEHLPPDFQADQMWSGVCVRECVGRLRILP